MEGGGISLKQTIEASNCRSPWFRAGKDPSRKEWRAECSSGRRQDLSTRELIRWSREITSSGSRFRFLLSIRLMSRIDRSWWETSPTLWELKKVKIFLFDEMRNQREYYFFKNVRNTAYFVLKRTESLSFKKFVKRYRKLFLKNNCFENTLNSIYEGKILNSQNKISKI